MLLKLQESKEHPYCVLTVIAGFVVGACATAPGTKIKYEHRPENSTWYQFGTAESTQVVLVVASTGTYLPVGTSIRRILVVSW